MCVVRCIIESQLAPGLPVDRVLHLAQIMLSVWMRSTDSGKRQWAVFLLQKLIASHPSILPQLRLATSPALLQQEASHSPAEEVGGKQAMRTRMQRVSNDSISGGAPPASDTESEEELEASMAALSVSTCGYDSLQHLDGKAVSVSRDRPSSQAEEFSELLRRLGGSTEAPQTVDILGLALALRCCGQRLLHTQLTTLAASCRVDREGRMAIVDVVRIALPTLQPPLTPTDSRYLHVQGGGDRNFLGSISGFERVLWKTVVAQHSYEEPLVKAGTHLTYSKYLTAMVSLCYELKVDPEDYPTKGDHEWFTNYCMAADAVHSLVTREPFPQTFLDRIHSGLHGRLCADTTVASAAHGMSPSSFIDNREMTAEMDAQLIDWFVLSLPP